MIELERVVLNPVVEAELKAFEDMIDKLENGEIDSEDFKKFRLENGVYGIRGSTDTHMVRIKIRFGKILPEQLEVIAHLVETYTPNKLAHITTRQDIQMHYIHRKKLPQILRYINACGLTTREACGNTVRNVTCCPYTGVSKTQIFDVEPYADAVSAYHLRNPINQNLPRKFKITFESCSVDHAYVLIHDLGFIARIKDGVKGFKVFVGGGLGPTPQVAWLLEDFIPAKDVFFVTEAVLRIFDRYGERRDRNRARIKFLIRKWGIEEFKKVYSEEFKIAKLTSSGRITNMLNYISNYNYEKPDTKIIIEEPIEGYDLFLKTNVVEQNQDEYVSVIVRCLHGDITPEGLRKVAEISRNIGATIRTVITQNLVLRWVHKKNLPYVYNELKKAGLATPKAHTIADITRCPGADSCNLAFTRSKGLSQYLSELFENGMYKEELKNIRIKISGCFNSCGQHHTADIGFYGTSKKYGDKEVPQYVMLIGGVINFDNTKFAKPVMQIPAINIKPAVKKLLDYYIEKRNQDEKLPAFIDRVGIDEIKNLLGEFAEIKDSPEYFKDLGVDKEFSVMLGKGECAA